MLKGQNALVEMNKHERCPLMTEDQSHAVVITDKHLFNVCAETVIGDWLHMRSISYTWDVSMVQLVNVGARKPQLHAQSTQRTAGVKPGLDGRANHCTAEMTKDCQHVSGMKNMMSIYSERRDVVKFLFVTLSLSHCLHAHTCTQIGLHSALRLWESHHSPISRLSFRKGF